MRISPITVRVLIVLCAIVLLGVLRYRPWRDATAPSTGSLADAPTEVRERLVVGYLPVT